MCCVRVAGQLPVDVVVVAAELDPGPENGSDLKMSLPVAAAAVDVGVVWGRQQHANRSLGYTCIISTIMLLIHTEVTVHDRHVIYTCTYVYTIPC